MGGGRGGQGSNGVVLWVVGAVGVVRAVRARGGVGMHWQPLNTLIYKMQSVRRRVGEQ